MAAAGRTARERWKLYQNVTKLGLQRTKSSKVVATKTKAKAKTTTKPKTIRSASREIVLNMEDGVVGDVGAAGDTIVELPDRQASLQANAVNDAVVVVGDSSDKELDEADAVEEEDEEYADVDEQEVDDDEDEEDDLMAVVSLEVIKSNYFIVECFERQAHI